MHRFVHLVEELLGLFQSVVRVGDALAQLLVLVQGEVALLALFEQNLLFSLHLLLFAVPLVEAQEFVFPLLAVQHFLDQRGHVFGYVLTLDEGPDLHNGVFEFDLEFVLVEVLRILVWGSRVVVEDVVESYLVEGRVEDLLDVLPGLLQVSPLVHYLPHAVIRELEDADGSATDVVRV